MTHHNPHILYIHFRCIMNDAVMNKAVIITLDLQKLGRCLSNMGWWTDEATRFRILVVCLLLYFTGFINFITDIRERR